MYKKIIIIALYQTNISLKNISKQLNVPFSTAKKMEKILN